MTTTTLALLDALAEVRPPAIVSNFLLIISAAAQRSDIDVVALGGFYSVTDDSFLGAPCVAAAAGLRADLGSTRSPGWPMPRSTTRSRRWW
jgi:DeoR/GlpR family transcriptional regulator of sugar metabolism